MQSKISALILPLPALLLAGGVRAECLVAEMGGVALGERVRDVEVAGDFAYVAAGTDGLQIVDISQPTAPVVVGGAPALGFTRDVEVVGATAYVSDLSYRENAGGLRILDVSDASAPVELGRTGLSFRVSEVSGSVAYAIRDGYVDGTPQLGVEVIDVSVPTAPAVLGMIDLPGREISLRIEGQWAYMGVEDPRSQSSLVVLDIGNPVQPAQASTLETGSRLPLELQVTAGGLGAIASIGGFGRGLIVSDLADPVSPVELAFFPLPSARDVHLMGERAYFSYGTDPSFGGGPTGFRVFNVTDPSVPVDIGGVETAAGEFASIFVEQRLDGDWIHAGVSGQAGGLRSYRVSDCPQVAPIHVIPFMSGGIPLAASQFVLVSITGSPSVDVSALNVESLTFGPGGASPLVQPWLGDFNGDGFTDAIFLFLSDEAGFVGDEPQGCLYGLLAGEPLVGCEWVVLNHPPVARIVALPDKGHPSWHGQCACAALEVELFADQSFDPEGEELVYLWEFDDGTTAVGDRVTRLYRDIGEHVATLTVTDELGQVDVDSVEIEVILRPASQVPALSPPTLGCLAAILLAAGLAPLAGPARRDPGSDSRRAAAHW